MAADTPEDNTDAATDDTTTASYDELLENLEALEDTVSSSENRRRVRDSINLVQQASPHRLFGRAVRGFGKQDMAEALIGGLVFGIPMIVEGGTLEIGAFIAQHPLYFFGTLLFGVALVINILYVAEFQDVQVIDPLLGFIPRRLVGVLGVSFITATVLMTAWGRVDWVAPWVALNQVTVVFVVMAIGAALGDILPGT